MKQVAKKLATRLSVLACAAVLTACGSGGGGTTVLQSSSAAATKQTTYVQVERLGRPAINEGLLITNDYLNAFNGISPTADLAALGTPVGSEIVATLTALGNNQAAIGAIVSAFVPDVMRIDTNIASTYAGGVTFTGAAFTTDIATIPTGGRLIQDDIVDITLQVLLHDPTATDNVSYTGAPGNAAQGHSPLTTTFPYLAAPQ